jgi:ribosomal protein S18 acetylase RimI-like enzyme
MELRKIIEATIRECLNENFKTIEIDKEISEFILDMKEVTINGIVFKFIYPNLHGKNKFLIEVDGEGEVGSATLNLDGSYLDNIRIDPKYRRIGLATKMYEYIEELMGIKIKPSPIKQSAEIKNFWDKKKF